MGALGLVAAGWAYCLLGFAALVMLDALWPALRRRRRDDRDDIGTAALVLGLLVWPGLVVLCLAALMWRRRERAL